MIARPFSKQLLPAALPGESAAGAAAQPAAELPGGGGAARMLLVEIPSLCQCTADAASVRVPLCLVGQYEVQKALLAVDAAGACERSIGDFLEAMA